jgi:hypothetical protein
MVQGRDPDQDGPMSADEAFQEGDERDDEPEGASSLYVLPALRAPVAAVFLRVPGKWWHVMRWDLGSGELEPGAWLKGTLYPRRSDVSPNGRLLSYFLSKEGKGTFMGMQGRHRFHAVSKLPWVFALAAWPAPDTDTTGQAFADPPRLDLGAPHFGTAGPLGEAIGLGASEPLQYAVERRRGWVEHPSCPPRVPSDPFDEDRSVVLEKSHPSAADVKLILRDEGWDPEAPGAIDGRAPSYALEVGDHTDELDDVVWADWHPLTGHLLAATDDSRLVVRLPREREPIWERELSGVRRVAGPAPPWAQRW